MGPGRIILLLTWVLALAAFSGLLAVQVILGLRGGTIAGVNWEAVAEGVRGESGWVRALMNAALAYREGELFVMLSRGWDGAAFWWTLGSYLALASMLGGLAVFSPRR